MRSSCSVAMADRGIGAINIAGRGETAAYLTPSAIQRLIEDREIHPSKALGQNFLTDANQVRRICALAGVSPGDRVIEIGPGLGSLTIGLLASGADVVAVERDTRLAEVVEELAPAARVLIGDVLKLDLEGLLPADFRPPYKLVANLPYSIAATALLNSLEKLAGVESGLVMVQREVAERLVATPGRKAYGAISVYFAYWVTASVAGRVPSTVFIPRPKVESSLVTFARRPPPRCDREALFELVRAGFSTRRKTLANALTSLPWRDAALDACDAIGIDRRIRAEELGIDEFVEITERAGFSR